MKQIMLKLLAAYEQGRMSRRELVGCLAIAAAANEADAADSHPIVKAVYVNHISYRVADYTKTRDFYSGLFGVKVSEDDGKQCRLAVGETMIFPRTWPANTPQIDHVCYSVANRDADKDIFKTSLAEFKRAWNRSPRRRK